MSSQPLTHSEPYIIDDKTDAERYFEGVLDGSVIAGQKMHQLAEKMLPRIREGYKHWHYDPEAAIRPVRFMETFCVIPTGRLGQPLILEPFQRMMLETIFGFVDDDGNRQIQYALIEIGRKNAKSTIAAAIELYLLLADGEGAPQIYSAATSKAQAAGVYGAALRMVKRSSKLAKHVYKGTVVERQEDGIICKDNLGYITKLSHESSHLDGLDVHGAVYDELAAEKDRAAFDLIRQGTGARDQPLMIVITTQGFVRDNIWDTERDYGVRWLEDKLEDDRFLGIFFEMDDRSEIFNEQAWPKANPGLGSIKKWQYLRDQVNKARNDPQYLPTVLVKDFNIVANQATSFFTFEEASCDETFEFDPKRFRYCVVGFDVAERGDLNAAVAMFMEPNNDTIYEEAMYWIAEEQIKINSNSQKQRDGVPYHQWAADGWLQIVEGDKVDQIVFIDWMRSLADKGLYIYAVGFDKWHVDDWTRRQLDLMVGKGRVSEVIQGALTLSSPMKEIKIDHRANRIVDNGNPVTRWCRLNVMAKYDTNDNVTPIKKGLTASNRIDGFMAELDAYITLKRHWEGYQASL